VKVSLDLLRGDPENPRRIDDGHLDGLRLSVEEFGDLAGIVWNETTGELVCGHQRMRILREAGATEWTRDGSAGAIVHPQTGERFPVRIVAWDRETQRMANLVANSPHIAGEFTPAALEQLRAIEDRDMAEALRLTELEQQLAEQFADQLPDVPADGDTDPDSIPDAPAEPTTKRGDVWILGDHRLICGDCREPRDVDRLLDGCKINVAVTSPPYASQREYDESSGFKPIRPDEFVDWFEAVQSNVRRHLADDGSWFVNIKEHCEDGQRHAYVKRLTLAHVERWKWRFVDEFAWLHQGLPGSWPNRFKNAWEPVFHFSAQAAIKFRPKSVGHRSDHVFHEGGRVSDTNRTGNVGWNNGEVRYMSGTALPGNAIQLATNSAAGAAHPAAFPVGLPEFFIRAFSDPGDVIYDPFMGSGTTLIAAEKNGRHARGMELSPAYCDVIVARWESFTGRKAYRTDKPANAAAPEQSALGAPG
jgi:DNA modification methylase